MSLIASIFHFMFLYVLFPDIYFHSRETWNSWDGKSTYCVIQFSYEEKKKYSMFICNLWAVKQNLTCNKTHASSILVIRHIFRWFVFYLDRLIDWEMAELCMVGWPQLKNSPRYAHIGFLNTIDLVFNWLLVLKQALNLQMYLL